MQSFVAEAERIKREAMELVNHPDFCRLDDARQRGIRGHLLSAGTELELAARSARAGGAKATLAPPARDPDFRERQLPRGDRS